MCLGLASGYIASQSLLKKDRTEEFKEAICKDLCQFQNDHTLSQYELNACCAICPLNDLVKVEVKE